MRKKPIIPTLFMAAIFGACLLGLPFEPAYADPVTDSGNGVIYTLTESLSSTATTDTYTFTLAVNTAGYSGGSAFLDAVAIIGLGGSFSPDLTNSTLVSAPATGAPYIFDPGSPTNASGCNTLTTTTNFVCAQATASGNVVPNGTYTFVFSESVAAGTAVNLTDGTVKALYLDAGCTAQNPAPGCLNSQTSMAVPIQTNVPEPGTVLLLGLALVCGGVFYGWKRRNNVQA